MAEPDLEGPGSEDPVDPEPIDSVVGADPALCEVTQHIINTGGEYEPDQSVVGESADVLRPIVTDCGIGPDGA